METDLPILLPYGLSNEHRCIRILGKAGARSFVGYPRWRIPSLRALQAISSSSAVPLRLHNHNTSKNLPPLPNAPLEFAARNVREANMRVDMRASKARAGVTTKNRRGRTPKPPPKSKPQSRAAASNKIDTSQYPRRRPVGPGTRFGASKETPMIIDDDDDEEMNGLSYGASPAAQRKILSRGIRAPSSYSPDFRASTPPGGHTPGRNTFASHQSILAPLRETGAERRACEGSFYTGCVFMTCAIHQHRQHANMSSFIHDKNPDTNATCRTQSRHRFAKSHPPERQDDEVVTLGDIDDLVTRQNVAELMAVAPRLPVRDLYHLLVDMEGVGCGSTGQTGKRQKVLVLRELQRASIYTTR